MTPKQVLNAIEKMYPDKIFELDTFHENVIEHRMKIRVHGGEIYSDETYHTTEVIKERFCTVEFASMLLPSIPKSQKSKRKSPLKIYGSEVRV